jgi:hypothetical protein
VKTAITSGAVFQDSLFDPSRIVERTLERGTVIRMKLEPLGKQRVKVLAYYRKQRGGSWRRCTEEEGRVLDYWKLGLPQAYNSVFA